MTIAQDPLVGHLLLPYGMTPRFSESSCMKGHLRYIFMSKYPAVHDGKAECVKIDTEFIKLDSFLKAEGLVASGGEAKLLIMDGMVRVNGEAETRRGRKLYPGDRVEIEGRSYTVE